MAASEGAASLVVKSHSERLKEEQRIENQKKKEQELALAGTLKSEFSSGVKMGFAAGIPSAPVHQMKVSALMHFFECPQGSRHGRCIYLLLFFNPFPLPLCLTKRLTDHSLEYFTYIDFTL